MIGFRTLAVSSLLCSLGLAFSLSADAQGRLPDKQKPPKTAAPKKAAGKAPEVDLNLPTFGAIPNEKLNAPGETTETVVPTVSAVAAEYKVVSVTHAKSFMRGPGGSKPIGSALREISLSGNPPESEKFTTVVRVRCPQRTSAPIEINIIGPRGQTFMSGRGEVSFRGVKQDEVDYTLEWDPTTSNDSGTYDVQVRVAGRSMGSWPLTFTVR